MLKNKISSLLKKDSIEQPILLEEKPKEILK